MSLRIHTPCDDLEICPFEAGRYADCEYWCGAEEPEDMPEEEDE